MRPDRIIVGEVRGAEALDMLQAMNTGHEGSLSTVHANSPRDALNRLETMVLMAGYELPLRAIREPRLVGARPDRPARPARRRLAPRASRSREVQRMEGEVITLQKLFEFKIDRFDAERRIDRPARSRPVCGPAFLGEVRAARDRAAAEPLRRHRAARSTAPTRQALRRVGRGGATTDDAPSRTPRCSRRRHHARRRRGCGRPGAGDRASVQVAPVTRLPFPERGYVVSIPECASLDARSVVVRENGVRVTGDSRRPACGQRAALRRRPRARREREHDRRARGRGARGRSHVRRRTGARPRRSASSRSTARSRCSAT